MSLGRLALAAPAKINLALAVLGPRADGFHELITVMHTVDLCDEVVLVLSEEETGTANRVSLEVTGPHAAGLGDPRHNLAVRAANALLQCAGLGDEVVLQIKLEKRIPAGGGLGGGSSDAAAVLVGLNRLLGEPCTSGQLHGLASVLGSDVPFFLLGGCALCTGRGEICRAIQGPQAFDLTLVMPDIALSTAAVYSALAAGRAADRDAPDIDAWLADFADADATKLEALYFNDLQSAAISLEPRLGEWIDRHRLHLSGSGSTLFAFGDRSADLSGACEAALICSVRSTSGKQ